MKWWVAFFAMVVIFLSGCTQEPACGNGTCDTGETGACPQDCADAACGNSVCDLGESPSSCPADCPLPPACGNGQCESGETSASCPADCAPQPVCGNAICDAGETTACPADCLQQPVCGNIICESGETPQSCPADCSSRCGNGQCESGESLAACPADCLPQPSCGNGACESGETTASCLADCFQPGIYCGNGICDPAETSQSCLRDCPLRAVCGNAVCEAGESAAVCPQDCAAPPCGNGVCEAAETVVSCPGDCAPRPVCGNALCETGETPQSCPADCGPQPVCGNGVCDSGESPPSCPADCVTAAAAPTCIFPTSFTLHPQGNPLKTTGGSNLRGPDPFVMFDASDNKWKMWRTEFRSNVLGIAYAESADGLVWTDFPGHVLQPTPGTWDLRGLETVSVTKKNSQYVMLYMGYPGLNPDGTLFTGSGRRKHIGIATSADGKSGWQKGPSNPVIAPILPWEQPWTVTSNEGGQPVTYLEGGVEETSLAWNQSGQLFEAWYSAGAVLNGKWQIQIGYASSADGATFTKHPANPVFTPGPAGSWDDSIVGHTNVIPDPTLGYHLFYYGGQSTSNTGIGHAYSADGIAWQRNSRNPFLRGSVSDTLQDYMVGGPSAVIHGGTIYLYTMRTAPLTAVGQPLLYAGEVYLYLYTAEVSACSGA